MEKKRIGMTNVSGKLTNVSMQYEELLFKIRYEPATIATIL